MVATSLLHALCAISALLTLPAQAGRADLQRMQHHKRLKTTRTVERRLQSGDAKQKRGQDWQQGQNGYDAASGTQPTSSQSSWGVQASIGISIGSSPSDAKYKLSTNMTGDALYSDENWSYFSDSDPTHGTVNYVNSQTARSSGLVYTNDQGQFILKVDNSSWVDSNRNSVRISSKVEIEQGQLLLFDATHAPTGCSTWPAFWLLGSEGDWPYAGEVDIVELVNNIGNNQFTLHTTGGDIAGETGYNGTLGDVSSCDATNGGAGCGILDGQNTGGPGLNEGDGGVWATLWDDDGWKMWFFARADIPDNIYANNPCPDSWGLPAAYFSADRVPASMFKKLQMIINTTICGDWAGNVLPDNSQGCSQTCSAYVQDPSNFDEAYWAINGIYIYDGPSSSGIDVDVSASVGW